jgi:hypothetical protein
MYSLRKLLGVKTKLEIYASNGHAKILEKLNTTSTK